MNGLAELALVSGAVNILLAWALWRASKQAIYWRGQAERFSKMVERYQKARRRPRRFVPVVVGGTNGASVIDTTRLSSHQANPIKGT